MKAKSTRRNVFAVLATSVLLAAAAAQSAHASDNNAMTNGGYDYASKFYRHPAGLALYLQAPESVDDVAVVDQAEGGGGADVTVHSDETANAVRFDTSDPSYQQFLREVLERSGG
jgi:hypothetical protein